MQIGPLTLELVKPEKLEEQLVASTGFLVAEVRDHLSRAAIAGFVASALRPFVKDPPAMIAVGEAMDVANDLRRTAAARGKAFLLPNVPMSRNIQ